MVYVRKKYLPTEQTTNVFSTQERNNCFQRSKLKIVSKEQNKKMSTGENYDSFTKRHSSRKVIKKFQVRNTRNSDFYASNYTAYYLLQRSIALVISRATSDRRVVQETQIPNYVLRHRHKRPLVVKADFASLPVPKD